MKKNTCADLVRNGKPYPDDWDIRFSLAASKAYAGMTLAEGAGIERNYVIGTGVKKVDFSYN